MILMYLCLNVLALQETQEHILSMLMMTGINPADFQLCQRLGPTGESKSGVKTLKI